MTKFMRKLWKDEGGFVISVELILIVTILVIGLVSGWTMLRDAVLAELSDTANAIGSIDQSFGVSGISYDDGNGAASAGFGWGDQMDAADDYDGNGLPLAAGLKVDANDYLVQGNQQETTN